MVNVPVGLGESGAPTATANTSTTSLFSITASLRSGMLTTSRRTTASLAVSAASARPIIAPAIRTAAIHIARLALMSSSVVSRRRRATDQPKAKRLSLGDLIDNQRKECVSAGPRRVWADTLGDGCFQ